MESLILVNRRPDESLTGEDSELRTWAASPELDLSLLCKAHAPRLGFFAEYARSCCYPTTAGLQSGVKGPYYSTAPSRSNGRGPGMAFQKPQSSELRKCFPTAELNQMHLEYPDVRSPFALPWAPNSTCEP